MTNSTLGYLKDLFVAVIGVLTVFQIWSPTEEQMGALLILFSAVGAIVLAFNTAKGKPSEIRSAARQQGVDV